MKKEMLPIETSQAGLGKYYGNSDVLHDAFGNRLVYVEYDDTKYNVHFFESECGFALIKLANHRLLKVFPADGLMEITQHNVNGEDNFVVLYDKTDKNRVFFQHYKCVEDNTEFYPVERNWFYNVSYKANHTYMVSDGFMNCFYNLDKVSYVFEKSYEMVDTPEIKKLKEKNIWLVGLETGAPDEYHDFLVYGINLDTSKIVTPIWSQLQQRFIPVYSEEQVEKANSLCKDPEELTIRLEVYKYLEMLGGMNATFTNNIEDEVIVEEIAKKLVRSMEKEGKKK